MFAMPLSQTALCFKRSQAAALTVGAMLALISAVATPAFAMDSKVVQQGAADLTNVRSLIKAENFAMAEEELRELEKKGPNADVYNLLGFSLRKQGKTDVSYDYYQKALKLEPNHKSAHEYLGELYIQTGRIDKAREHAKILATLCPEGCEEREDLDEALAKVQPK